MEQLDLNLKQALVLVQKKNFITGGVEGKLFRIPGAEDILIKVYHNLQTPKYFTEKLTAFHNEIELDDIIARPLQLVTLNQVPIGYTMREFGVSLEQLNVSFAERINILEQCRDIITRLHQKGIILGDIKLQNFLYKDGKVKVCDICNARVGPYDITVKNTITKYHESERHVIDENTDIQAFNYMTYVFLKYGVMNLTNKKFIHSFKKILEYDLQSHRIPKCFDTDAYSILKKIYDIDKENISNEYLLDHVIR